MDDAGHMPVLPQEVTAMLTPEPADAPQAGQMARTVLDCTVGRGGHGVLLIPRLGRGGRYVGLDLDPINVEFAGRRLEPIAVEAGVDVHVVHQGFQHARAVLAELGIDQVDGLLADLGFASNQMDDPQRGFAFSDDGPLDMRLNPDSTPTAGDLVNQLPETDLANLIYEFGEERRSRRIARKIVERRAQSPIQRTSELAELVRRAYGPAANRGHRHRQRIHPATRTFMALRIAVNDELASLDRLLEDLPGLLAPRGRAAIISFHSLEDRRVKQAFLAMQQQEIGQRLTRKPITAGDAEMVANPRSRSAKLRGFEKY